MIDGRFAFIATFFSSLSAFFIFLACRMILAYFKTQNKKGKQPDG
jgi:hypothetical protein